MAASSSTPIPCRSIATCVSSRRGRRRPRRQSCRTGSMATSTRRRCGRVAAGETSWVGRGCADAPAALREAGRDGLRRILVGGTGLYFKALTQGLAAVPPVPGDVRAVVRARLKAEGIAPLYEEL